MADHLRFSPDILRRLGEELVPDVDQGIIELVKNAYDADATECTVTLRDINSGHGTIEISDNGTGMTESEIRDGWLVIGRSGKKRKGVTPKFGRVAVGDKGLGRLAALRLGQTVTLRTASEAATAKLLELKIKWSEFENAKTVEDVDLNVTQKGEAKKRGTFITIEGIAAKLTKSTVNKLARSLILLSDPFAKMDHQLRAAIKVNKSKLGDPGFVAVLQTPEFKDLQLKVNKGYFDDAEYIVSAALDETGFARFSILDWRGQNLHEYKPPKSYQTVPFSFSLWVFLLKGDSFSTRRSTVGEVRDWLSAVGGVHIYEDEIRVPPYGGSENDWLDLNLRRARSPELRPSTNTSVGRVKFSNIDRTLAQKTDRVGYIENEAFQELKRCCGDALDWAARVQVRERDKKRESERAEREEKAKKATKSLDVVLSKTVSPTDRKRVEDAIQSYVKESEKEAKSLREELQLYRSLATAGMASAVFAHEIGRPLKLIDDAVKSLARLVPEKNKEDAQSRIAKIQSHKTRLDSFISIPLRLLSKEKRRTGRIDINQTVNRLAELLRPITGYYKVDLALNLTEGYAVAKGSEALFDGIVLNFLLNSIAAFQREGYLQQSRKIEISTVVEGTHLNLSVQDNAGGIDGIPIEDIWLPGATTSQDGTGFGLTIVKDSVQDLGGTVSVLPITKFGGALFSVRIPIMAELM
jgi:signal transduction histidine kinase